MGINFDNNEDDAAMLAELLAMEQDVTNDDKQFQDKRQTQITKTKIKEEQTKVQAEKLKSKPTRIKLKKNKPKFKPTRLKQQNLEDDINKIFEQGILGEIISKEENPTTLSGKQYLELRKQLASLSAEDRKKLNPKLLDPKKYRRTTRYYC